LYLSIELHSGLFGISQGGSHGCVRAGQARVHPAADTEARARLAQPAAAGATAAAAATATAAATVVDVAGQFHRPDFVLCPHVWQYESVEFVLAANQA